MVVGVEGGERLCVSEESYRNFAYDYIRLEPGDLYLPGIGRKNLGKYVLVRGIFDSKDTGHEDLHYYGTIKDIFDYDLIEELYVNKLIDGESPTDE